MKKGAARTLCLRTASATYTRTVRIQTAVRTRTIAKANCAVKKGAARSACNSTANARYRVAIARARGR